MPLIRMIALEQDNVHLLAHLPMVPVILKLSVSKNRGSRRGSALGDAPILGRVLLRNKSIGLLVYIAAHREIRDSSEAVRHIVLSGYTGGSRDAFQT